MIWVAVISLLAAALLGYLLARHSAKGVLIPWAVLGLALVWLVVSGSMATGEYAGLGEIILGVLVWAPACLGLALATLLGRFLRARAQRQGMVSVRPLR